MASARGAGGRLLRWLRDGSLRRAAANVVLGRRMRERVVGAGRRSAKIATDSELGGRDAAASGAIATRIRCAPNGGLRGKFVVGYSGNMGRAHEFQTMIDAADGLRAQTDIVFLFVGGGAQKADARERGAGARIAQPRVQAVPAARAARPEPGRRRCPSRHAAPGARRARRAEQVLRHRRGRPADDLHRRSGGRDRIGRARGGVRDVRASRAMSPASSRPSRRCATIRRCASGWAPTRGACSKRRYDKPIAIERWRRCWRTQLLARRADEP